MAQMATIVMNNFDNLFIMHLFNWLLIRSKTKALARLSGAKAYAVTECADIALLLSDAAQCMAALQQRVLRLYHTRET